jgi:hypothetical protein
MAPAKGKKCLVKECEQEKTHHTVDCPVLLGIDLYKRSLHHTTSLASFEGTCSEEYCGIQMGAAKANT